MTVKNLNDPKTLWINFTWKFTCVSAWDFWRKSKISSTLRSSKSFFNSSVFSARCWPLNLVEVRLAKHNQHHRDLPGYSGIPEGPRGPRAYGVYHTYYQQKPGLSQRSFGVQAEISWQHYISPICCQSFFATLKICPFKKCWYGNLVLDNLPFCQLYSLRLQSTLL